MTGIGFAIVAYVISGVLIGGYALRLWLGLRRAGRHQSSRRG